MALTREYSLRRIRIVPTFNKLLVEPIRESRETKSGLFIPDVVKERATRGRVLEVGPGKRNDDGTFIPLIVGVGDIIYFSAIAGNTLKGTLRTAERKTDDPELLILREEDILAIEETEEEEGGENA